MSRPTTEGKGASSPVTNSLPACDCPGEVAELDPQPTSTRVASKVDAVKLEQTTSSWHVPEKDSWGSHLFLVQIWEHAFFGKVV